MCGEEGAKNLQRRGEGECARAYIDTKKDKHGKTKLLRSLVQWDCLIIRLREESVPGATDFGAGVFVLGSFSSCCLSLMPLTTL